MKLFTCLVLVVLPATSCSSREQLHPNIRKEISQWAEDALAPPVFCGKIVKLEYDSTKIADGSPVYFDNGTGERIAQCDNPMIRIPPENRVRCPPVQWTCPG